MERPDVTRTALAVVAVFAAHTFSILLTEPLSPARAARASVAMAAGTRDAAGAKVASSSRGRDRADRTREATLQTTATTGRAPDLTAYHGLGSWIDLFDKGPWKNPSGTVARADDRSVRTIYLQTATYGSPRHIVYRRKVGEFIAAAHRRNMTVVGWSVPSFTQWRQDFRRAKAALLFETKAGERLDSFALDIEAAIIRDIDTRNARLIKISDRLRKVAGDDYTLGAIIPDTHSTYWPRFPYRELARRYDVMVPMGYFTFRTRDYDGVRRYTTANIKVIRKKAGKQMPIHVIGGIADDVGVAAARGFVEAVEKHRVLGASLYDFPITSKKTWKQLSSVSDPRSVGRHGSRGTPAGRRP
ncbi:MAG TPA: hypothetical protein VG929_10955 [Actinomycetota bacterium]|nr:hypothetical protein [Actinomycetota bacterium]